MSERVKVVFDYDNERSVISRGGGDKQFTVKAGVGVIKPLQLMAMEYSSGQLVKYNSAGSGGTNIPLTVYSGTEDLDATLETTAPCLVPGCVINIAAVNGFDPAADHQVVAELFANSFILEEVR